MIDHLVTYPLSGSQEFKYSVVIPTWNNLDYLKICMESLQLHSILPHQVIVFVNEGSDGTLDWLKALDAGHLDFIHSPSNLGICYGVNLCRPLMKSPYLIYLNDDMYVLPGWDRTLFDVVHTLDTKMFMLSATMIEPTYTANNCVIVKDYGTEPGSFQKELLLREFADLKQDDWQGSTWPPTLVHVDVWDLVGGFSPEFSPGLYSDPDLTFKLLMAGVRIFKGIGKSRVYHFGSKSTSRIQKNGGRKRFIAKWGISANEFKNRALKMGTSYHGPLPDHVGHLRMGVLNRIKRWLYSWSSSNML
jgi:GT2 family glycosyltransferase